MWWHIITETGTPSASVASGAELSCEGGGAIATIEKSTRDASNQRDFLKCVTSYPSFTVMVCPRVYYCTNLELIGERLSFMSCCSPGADARSRFPLFGLQLLLHLPTAFSMQLHHSLCVTRSDEEAADAFLCWLTYFQLLFLNLQPALFTFNAQLFFVNILYLLLQLLWIGLSLFTWNAFCQKAFYVLYQANYCDWIWSQTNNIYFSIYMCKSLKWKSLWKENVTLNDYHYSCQRTSNYPINRTRGQMLNSQNVSGKWGSIIAPREKWCISSVAPFSILTISPPLISPLGTLFHYLWTGGTVNLCLWHAGVDLNHIRQQNRVFLHVYSLEAVMDCGWCLVHLR